MKKILSAILALTLTASAFSLSAFAEDNSNTLSTAPNSIGTFSLAYENLTYELNADGTAVITGYTGSSKEVTIPSAVDGHTVTEIAANAFYKSDITSVTIPSSVKKIGKKAFCGSKLTSLELPEGVEELGDMAFLDCLDLKDMTVPKSVKTIGSRAFGLYYNNVYIPSSDNETEGEWSDEYSPIDGFKVHCYTGSKAYYYADVHGLEIVSLDYVTVGDLELSQAAFSGSTIKLKWNKVSGATGYKVRVNGKTVKTIRNASETSYTVKNVASDKIYRINVQPFYQDDFITFWGNADAVTKAKNFTAPTITGASKSTTSVNLKWTKVNCDGYKIQQYNAKTKKWKTVKIVEGANKTSSKITGLESGTAYKFRVRAFLYVNNPSVRAEDTNSAWSAAKKVTTKS